MKISRIPNRWISQWIADHLPKWVVHCAIIRVIDYATSGEYKSIILPESRAMVELRAVEALNRWEDKP